MNPKLIQVIQVDMPRGKGTDEDPMRLVRQYFTPDGEFLAEVDIITNKWVEEEAERRAKGE